MSIITQPTRSVNIKEESFFAELGLRIARARKERSITQVHLAVWLGNAQQTPTHYEVGPAKPVSAQAD